MLRGGLSLVCMAVAIAEEGTLQDEVPMLAQSDIIHQGWGTSRDEGMITSAPTAADVPPPTLIPPVRSEISGGCELSLSTCTV